MNRDKIEIYLIWLLFADAVFQLFGATSFGFKNVTISWLLEYPFYILCTIYCVKNKEYFELRNICIFLYFLWLAFDIFRGFFAAETYFEFKFFLSNILTLSIPFFAIIFQKPLVIIDFFNKWNRLLPFILLLLFAGLMGKTQIHFFSGPTYYLLGSFIFLIPSRKWRIMVLGLVIYMFFADFGARSQVIKSLIAITMSCAVLAKRIIPNFLVQLAGISFYILPIIFLYLGITGRYNIFDHIDHSEVHVVEFVEGEMQIDEVNKDLVDTRTFIYAEVLLSAVNNNYIWIGRTPARGNDSPTFAEQIKADRGPNARPERNSNELCHLNVFTWLGLIGVVLYALIYIFSSVLALFFSNSFYLKLLGALVAFNWLFGWIENMNKMDMLNVGQWMVIGLCVSKEFRKMTDKEFSIWFSSLFYFDINRNPYSMSIITQKIIKIEILKRLLSKKDDARKIGQEN